MERFFVLNHYVDYVPNILTELLCEGKYTFYYIKPLKFGDLFVVTATVTLMNRKHPIGGIIQRKRKKGFILLN